MHARLPTATIVSFSTAYMCYKVNVGNKKKVEARNALRGNIDSSGSVIILKSWCEEFTARGTRPFCSFYSPYSLTCFQPILAHRSPVPTLRMPFKPSLLYSLIWLKPTWAVKGGKPICVEANPVEIEAYLACFSSQPCPYRIHKDRSWFDIPKPHRGLEDWACRMGIFSMLIMITLILLLLLDRISSSSLPDAYNFWGYLLITIAIRASSTNLPLGLVGAWNRSPLNSLAPTCNYGNNIKSNCCWFNLDLTPYHPWVAGICHYLLVMIWLKFYAGTVYFCW